jgi:hypothetical protein
VKRDLATVRVAELDRAAAERRKPIIDRARVSLKRAAMR